MKIEQTKSKYPETSFTHHTTEESSRAEVEDGEKRFLPWKEAEKEYDTTRLPVSRSNSPLTRQENDRSDNDEGESISNSIHTVYPHFNRSEESSGVSFIATNLGEDILIPGNYYLISLFINRKSIPIYVSISK